jgi:ABC-type uncharacterized transport system permease subunit
MEWSSILALLTPIFLVSLGGLFSERAGVLNIGLEGIILLGAFTGYLGLEETGSVFFGGLMAVTAGLFLTSLMALSVHQLKSNVFIAGLAVNLLASGLVPLMARGIYGTTGVLNLSPDRSPEASRVPLVFFTVGLFLLAASWYFLWKTSYGLRMRTVGDYPKVAAQKGLNLGSYRWLGLLLSGILAAAAGYTLVLRLGAFVPLISAGKGWIALVVIFLGFRHPLGMLLGSFLFAFAEILGISLETSLAAGRDWFLAFPFLVTLGVMIAYKAVETVREKALLKRK